MNRMTANGGGLGSARAWRGGACFAVVGMATAMMAPEASAGIVDEVNARATGVSVQRVYYRPGASVRGTAGAPVSPSPFVPRGPGCNQVVVSLAAGFDSLDVGSEITMQAGMVEQEGFGQTYIVPDPNPATPTNEAFPITVNLVEFLLATVGSVSGSNGQPVRAGYTIDVYDGEPVSGNAPVFSVASTNDPANNPELPEDALLQRVGGAACQPCGSANLSASVAKVQFSVDPGSPGDQIIIQGLDQAGGVATGRFTVMVRIHRMHETTPYGACTFGIVNDCGPLNRCSNVFMCTESNNGGALNHPTRNWLAARNCGALACAGGNWRFSQLSSGGGVSSGCRPSRDTLIQTTYTPAVCTVAAQGACCNASGTCTIASAGACTGALTYQGNGSVCAPNPCPQTATGACCTNGSCSSITESTCVGNGGVFQGAGVSCSGVTCGASGGACCSSASSFCFNLSQSECAGATGFFQGNGTTCTPDFQCPAGACCSGAGVCTAMQSPLQCSTAGGTYKGNGVTCQANTCPPASGACCFAGGFCSAATQPVCAGFANTTFIAAGVCSPNPCPQPGVCCRGATCAIGVTPAGCTASAPVGALYVAGAAACNSGGSGSSPCCWADFNKTGGRTVGDIFDFLTAWFAGNPFAQVNGSGAGTPVVADIFAFLTAWFAGAC